MYSLALVGLAVAWYFADKAWHRPRAGLILAAIAWLLYAVFEFLIARGVLCDANCNIRVDIFLIWPLLWIVSLFGLNAPGEWSTGSRILGLICCIIIAAIAAIFAYITFVETPAAWRKHEAECAAGTKDAKECQPPAAPEGGPAGKK